MRALSLCASALLAASACATTAPPPPPAPIAEAPPPRWAPKKVKKRPMKLSELAARLDSPDACGRAVSKLALRSEKAAWVLMKQCIRQSKFTDLMMLVQDPWVGRLNKLPPLEQARLLTHVMAMRGARFDVDLDLVSGVGPRLYELRKLIELGGAPNAPLVVFRGVVDDRELERSGLTRFSVIETTPVGVLVRDDVERRATAVFKLRRTRRSLRIGEEFVFLARADKIRGGQAELSVLGSFKRGVRAVINRR